MRSTPTRNFLGAGGSALQACARISPFRKHRAVNRLGVGEAAVPLRRGARTIIASTKSQGCPRGAEGTHVLARSNGRRVIAGHLGRRPLVTNVPVRPRSAAYLVGAPAATLECGGQSMTEPTALLLQRIHAREARIGVVGMGYVLSLIHI